MTKKKVSRGGIQRRAYQADALRKLPGLLRKHHRVLAVAPTGSGKTTIGALLVKAMRSKRVLWLAHRIELLRQARAELLAAGLKDSEVGILSGAETEHSSARILVASVAMFGRGRPVPKVDLVVLDEAHHAKAKTYERILKSAARAKVIGLTATPQREDGEPLGDIFRHLFVMAEPVELIADRYLLPAAVYAVPEDKARKLVRGAGTGKEYSAKKLEKTLKKRPLMADIVKERERIAKGERTIVYACTRAHGEALAARFKAAKVRTAYVDQKTPKKQREALLGRDGSFASGEVELVVNVGVLTEGFDCPPASCIVVARPTKSLVLWRQMCGRGARPWRGKRRYVVLDHAGNVWRHGFPDSPMSWSLSGRAKQKGDQPLRLCPECAAVVPLSARECPECGTELPLTEKELSERKGELEAAKRLALEGARVLAELGKIAKARSLPRSWVLQAASKLGVAA